MYFFIFQKLSEAKVREVLKERNLVKNERYETTPKPSTTTQRWFPTAPSSTTLVLTTSTKPSTTTQGPFPTARSSTTLVLTTSTTTRKPFATTKNFGSTTSKPKIFKDESTQNFKVEETLENPVRKFLKFYIS